MDYYLLLPKQGKTRTRLNEWLEPVEDEIRISMELDSTEMMKRFVMAGLGVSFLAVSNCREEIAAGKLRALPLAPEPMVRRLGLIYRKDKALSKAALGFIQVVHEHLGNEDAPAARAARSAGSGMTACARCGREFQESAPCCPGCGERNPAAAGLFQTSSVLISAGGCDRVYRSIDDVPAVLRNRLLRSTNGRNAGYDPDHRPQRPPHDRQGSEQAPRTQPEAGCPGGRKGIARSAGLADARTPPVDWRHRLPGCPSRGRGRLPDSLEVADRKTLS